MEEDPGGVREDDLFGLVVEAGSLSRVQALISPVQQGIHAGIGIPGKVALGSDIAAVKEHREKILWVGIVRQPPEAEQLRLTPVHQVEIGGPVQFSQRDHHPDPPERPLDKLGNFPVHQAGVVIEGHGREPPPPLISCLG